MSDMMQIGLTGSSGFLGTNISKELEGLENFNVLRIGRQPSDEFMFDLSEESTTLIPVDYCIHCAGLAHVTPGNEQEADLFHRINTKGTKNLLDSMDSSKLKGFVFISTVAVYGLDEGEQISEDTDLKANTPYGISKLKAEQVVINWCETRHIPFLILRLPLIVGTNPPGNLDKMRRGMLSGRYATIRGNQARKSVVFAGDVGSVIARWIQSGMKTSGTYNLTDRVHPKFTEIEHRVQEQLGVKRVLKLPMAFARVLARVGDTISVIPVNSDMLRKITSTLTFNDDKAQKELSYQPQPALPNLKVNRNPIPS